MIHDLRNWHEKTRYGVLQRGWYSNPALLLPRPDPFYNVSSIYTSKKKSLLKLSYICVSQANL
jgi:hypothetical protein